MGSKTEEETQGSLSLKEALIIIDTFNHILGEKIIPQLPDKEGDLSLIPLKTLLYINIYLRLKRYIESYDKEVNGIYNPETKKKKVF